MALHASSVAVGQALPELEKTLSAQTVIAGAAASRDWQPLHHDYKWSTEKGGLRDIIMNAPTQAGWLSRVVTDWAGPLARIGRMRFRLKSSLCPGDVMVIRASVIAVSESTPAGTWAEIDMQVCVGDEVRTLAQVIVALPDAGQPNPWQCPAHLWQPAGFSRE